VVNFPVGVSTSSSEYAAALSTRLRRHAQIGEARCLLCSVVYKQFYVGVVLCEGGQPLGDLCPRCLSVSPARCAQKVWCRASRLWAEIGEAVFGDAFLLSGEEAEEERRRRAEDRQRRETERRLRLANPLPVAPEPEPVTQAEKEHMADLLLTVAEGLGRLQKWPISVAAVQEAERAALRAHVRNDPRRRRRLN